MKTRAATVMVLTVTMALAGCTDSSGGGDADGPPPAEVLAEAGQTLAETSGVRIHLSTNNLPEGVTGLTRAVGVATNAPAFEGSISVIFAGQAVDVPVIAVDGKVYAVIPFSDGSYQDVDPKEYGAPDPAGLVNSETGFSSLLEQTDRPVAGDSVRGGENNTEVLTPYTGVVPGPAMKKVIPSASGDSFKAEYLVTDDGELRQAEFSGVFYPGSDSMTYTVDFDDYGTEQDITAP